MIELNRDQYDYMLWLSEIGPEPRDIVDVATDDLAKEGLIHVIDDSQADSFDDAIGRYRQQHEEISEKWQEISRLERRTTGIINLCFRSTPDLLKDRRRLKELGHNYDSDYSTYSDTMEILVKEFGLTYQETQGPEEGRHFCDLRTDLKRSDEGAYSLGPSSLDLTTYKGLAQGMAARLTVNGANALNNYYEQNVKFKWRSGAVTTMTHHNKDVVPGA